MRLAVHAVLILLLATLLAAQSAPTNKPLTNADVIKMSKAGLEEATIILAIQQHATQFDTSPDGLIELKTQGVQQAVIQAMLAAGSPPEANRTTPPASGSPTSVLPDRGATGKWKMVEDKSPFDDSKTVSLMVDAEDSIRGPVKTQVPTLIVRCKERETSVYVHTGMAASVEYGTEGHSVRLRVDDRPPFVQEWGESTSDDALFAGDSLQLLKQLANARTFVFGFTPFDAAPAVAQFNVGGLGSLVAGTQDACGWDQIFAAYRTAGAATGSRPAANASCPVAVTGVDPFAAVMFSKHSIQLKVMYRNTGDKEIVQSNFGGNFYDSHFEHLQTSTDYATDDHLKPGETRTSSWGNEKMHRRIPSGGRKGDVWLMKAVFADGTSWEDNGSKSCRGQSWQ